MKNIIYELTIFVMSVFFITQHTVAQNNKHFFDKKHEGFSKTYGYIFLGPGLMSIKNKSALLAVFNLGSSFIFNNGWGVSICSNFSSAASKNKPLDYDPGLQIFFNSDPRDRYRSVGLTLIKLFEIGETRHRAGFEIGPSSVSNIIVLYTERQGPQWLTSNYDIDYNSTTYYGALLKANIMYYPTSTVGFELSAFQQINKGNPQTGAQVRLLLDLVGQPNEEQIKRRKEREKERKKERQKRL